MEFAKIPTPDSFNFFYRYFFKNKTGVFWEFWQDLTGNPNGVMKLKKFETEVH